MAFFGLYIESICAFGVSGLRGPDRAIVIRGFLLLILSDTAAPLSLGAGQMGSYANGVRRI